MQAAKSNLTRLAGPIQRLSTCAVHPSTSFSKTHVLSKASACVTPFSRSPISPSTVAPSAIRSLTIAAAGGDVAGNGDYVQVHYVGTLDDGTEFDSSRHVGREPLDFIISEGRVVPGFEKIATGMAVGEKRTERITPDLAYGEWSENMTARVPIANAPPGIEASAMVQLQNGMQALVTEVTDEFVSIDANHPLAGKSLTFEVELLKLVKAEKMKKATFGAGCFWSVELVFQRVPGVLSTSVGYSNGAREGLTYEEVCRGDTGANEVVEMVYDEDEVSYDQLLETFFQKHDPTTLNRQGNDVGEQYRSGIYYHSEEQKKAAEAAVEKLNEKLSGQVVTEIEPIKNFSAAEEYHQQYLAKGGRFGRPQSAAKGCTDPIRCYG